MESTTQLESQIQARTAETPDESSTGTVDLEARRSAKRLSSRMDDPGESEATPSPREFCAQLRDEVIQDYDRLDGPTRHVAGLATFLADRDLELTEFENVLGTLAKSKGTPELTKAAKRILTRWRPYRRHCA
jgi:hypothetical protein